MVIQLPDRNSPKAIAYLCITGLALGVIFLCHHRSYRDAELVGSWRITTGRATQTFTFSPNHSFTIVFASSKDLRVFGDWAIDHGQLVITSLSNSWTAPVTNCQVARIGKLTDSVLILKDRDKLSDEPRERRFQKLKL